MQASTQKYTKLDVKSSDFVYLDLESPTDHNGGTHQCISSIGYTDGRNSYLEYIKFSKKCLVTDIMVTEFHSPPSEFYRGGRRIKEALQDLEKFANGRPILTYGDFDKRLIDLDSERFNLNLNLNIVDFKESVVTPTKGYSLSLSRLVELLGIEGNFVDHNPLHDALKLKAVHEKYEDTPEFRQKVFQYYLETETKSIIKMVESRVPEGNQQLLEN